MLRKLASWNQIRRLKVNNLLIDSLIVVNNSGVVLGNKSGGRRNLQCELMLQGELDELVNLLSEVGRRFEVEEDTVRKRS